MDDDALPAEQLAYYRAGAAEYDRPYAAAAALAPGGRAIFIDDGPAGAAEEDVLADHPVPAAVRRLHDGSPYRIVKVFHDARTLTNDLTALGWSVRIRPVAHRRTARSC